MIERKKDIHGCREDYVGVKPPNNELMSFYRHEKKMDPHYYRI